MSNFNLASEIHKHGLISDAEMRKHIDTALDEGGDDMRNAVHHPILTPGHIDRILNSDHDHLKLAAIMHPNASPANIDTVLGASNPLHLKLTAIRRPNATKSNLNKAANDRYPDIRIAALKIKNERNL